MSNKSRLYKWKALQIKDQIMPQWVLEKSMQKWDSYFLGQIKEYVSFKHEKK